MNRILMIVIVVVAVVTGVWLHGNHTGKTTIQARWSLAEQTRKQAEAETRSRQQTETVKVVTEYVDRVRIVKEKGSTLIKEIPVYVPSDTCQLPPGVRMLHDAAATGRVPDPARHLDAAPVSAPSLTETVILNYGTCLETAEQLTALQDWVRRMGKANEKID